jgi:hypothetical protein
MTNDILYIVVIYGIRLQDCYAWKGLHAAVDDADIYVHDNTANNVYLAKAYNKGLRYAKEKGYTWVALLDADTQVTQEYITAVNQTVMTQCPDSVYCPVLIGKNGKQLSPLRAYGIPVAFNSGLLIPVTIMDTLGGFNEAYPLDYLDYWLCYQLQQRHIALKSLEVRLQHALSVQDYAQMPAWRYRSLLEAEKRFAQESGNEKRYRWLLFCRLIKWALTGHPYVKETYRAWRER